MYTTSLEYETYTGETAPVDYERQELLATTLFKAQFPNFPSEETFNDLDTESQNCIKYAIFEQIKVGSSGLYGGTNGEADSFSVGNYSVSNGDTSQAGRISFMAQTYLDACGASYKGAGTCTSQSL